MNSKTEIFTTVSNNWCQSVTRYSYCVRARCCQKNCAPSKWGVLYYLIYTTDIRVNLRIQWRLIFANVIRCSRLQLWVGYFIYFKFTYVFFNSVEEINRLRNEINRLLRRFGILELRNRVPQNDVTFRVTNSKIFIEIPLSSY